jgi:hypothetical protein
MLFIGRVLGPVGGDGGNPLLSMLLRPGVDIRNLHLDGMQVCVFIIFKKNCNIEWLEVLWIRIRIRKNPNILAGSESEKSSDLDSDSDPDTV